MKFLALLLSLSVAGALLMALAPRLARAASIVMRDLSAGELARIEKGEIILESQTSSGANGSGSGLAIAFIQASKDKVIDTILKYEDYPKFMPHVKSTEVYKRTDSQVDVRFTVDVAFKKISYCRTIQVDRAAGTIVWSLDKTRKNDIADTEGFWGFKPYKNGIIVYYMASVDSGLAVPKMVEDYLTKRDLPNIVKSIRKRVEG
jgi:ribosome-associated toxin RatA of RatAB toxin-antitoxin module